MAILPGIFTSRPNTELNAGVTGKELTSQVSDANRQALLEMIDGLSVGDTILGKVLSQSGKNIQILTQEGFHINAKNDSKVLMEKGSSILFEVQKKTGKEISIRPLYQNTNFQNTAITALKQAGIPINGRSLEYVGRSMEYGNPIDRGSLSEAYKDVSLYPEASVKSIVDLQKMGIEINDNTILQYKAYSNMENSVTNSFNQISDGLINELIDELKATMMNNDAADFQSDFRGNFPLTIALNKVLDAFSNNNYNNGLFFTSEEFNSLVSDAENSGLELNNLINNSTLAASEEGFSPVSVLKGLLGDIEKPVQLLSLDNVAIDNEDLENDIQAQPFDAANALADFVSKDSVQNLFRKAFSSQWSINKDKLSDSVEIKDLYNRLFTQTKDMLNILDENLGKNNSISENIHNLHNNLEFMNELNSYMPYIQIPFHSEGKNENSELYVYANKKSLSSAEGEVTAFIHLDMENLGPTDIYVKLRDEHVSTNFTVKDEDTLILIEHHLDILNRRLEEKGYSLEAGVKVGKQEKSPMEQMLFDTQNHLVLADTSFDARV